MSDDERSVANSIDFEVLRFLETGPDSEALSFSPPPPPSPFLPNCRLNLRAGRVGVCGGRLQFS